jgi:hypothetical protein
VAAGFSLAGVAEGLAVAPFGRDTTCVICQRSLAVACALVGVGCIALGAGPTASAALAAAAGSGFEAAPFLLFANVLTPVLGPRLGPLAALGGCGCTRGPIPGALALPAIALCALSFGPLPTIARTVVALGVAARAGRPARRFRGRATPGLPGFRSGHSAEAAADLFADLEVIGACAFLASIATAALHAGVPVMPAPIAFLAGVGLGLLAPCATAGIAIAAAFAHSSPLIATGVLCSSGLLLPSGTADSPLLPGSMLGKTALTRRPERDARFAGAVLACALGCIALRGPSGLVTPRLLGPIGLAALVAFATLPGARTRAQTNALVPLLMLGSLVVVPQPPVYRADATRLDDAFPGERLSFIGVAGAARGSHSTLTRYAITCCRLDATPVSVRLNRRLDSSLEGRWIAATGSLTYSSGAGLELNPEQIHAIGQPADPFMYR